MADMELASCKRTGAGGAEDGGKVMELISFEEDGRACGRKEREGKGREGGWDREGGGRFLPRVDWPSLRREMEWNWN